ncbi:MAG TPA: class I SAM-dependent methyltransferase [Acidimicrobiales bacterium]|jgi:SAM-dependent methyltransferase|nr:class I SAM-dependent methyltransferase [Acidimicrobiales bacterium]
MAEQRGTTADDPFDGRDPTSHEQMTGRSWDASYLGERPAPWDIGQPQAAFVRVASVGGFTGDVLDAGCGTGEHALLAASLGHRVLGVDLAETAIALARKKAGERGLHAEFAVADAFELDRLGRTFETVLDCGLFHTCDGAERPRYVASLASVTRPAGTVYLLCFSDDAPDIGPHPTSRADLEAAFNEGSGWRIATLEPDTIRTTFVESGMPAWCVTITRLSPP